MKEQPQVFDELLMELPSGIILNGAKGTKNEMVIDEDSNYEDKVNVPEGTATEMKQSEGMKHRNEILCKFARQRIIPIDKYKIMDNFDEIYCEHAITVGNINEYPIVNNQIKFNTSFKEAHMNYIVGNLSGFYTNKYNYQGDLNKLKVCVDAVYPKGLKEPEKGREIYDKIMTRIVFFEMLIEKMTEYFKKGPYGV